MVLFLIKIQIFCCFLGGGKGMGVGAEDINGISIQFNGGGGFDIHMY